MTRMKIGFIGAGKVASKLAQCFSANGLNVVAISSMTLTSAERLAGSIPNCIATTSQDVFDLCDLIFIATPENQIQTVLSGVIIDASKIIVHCSGTVSSDQCGMFYVMHNFNSPLDIAGATIAIDSSDYDELRNIADAIKCHAIQVKQSDLFHAAIPYTQGFPVTLIKQGISMWSNLGIPKDVALQALVHLMKSMIQELEQSGIPENTLDDFTTIEKHIAAINQLNTQSAELYKQLTLQSAPLDIKLRSWLKDK